MQAASVASTSARLLFTPSFAFSTNRHQEVAAQTMKDHGAQLI